MSNRILPIILTLILVISALGLASGATQLVNETSVVSGPCTGTATLPDGSPNGLTTVYTGSCTGTITYQSTSTLPTTTSTSTTTTGLQNEMIQEVYNNTGLTNVPAMIAQWNSPAAPIGKDSFAVMEVISDNIHGYTVILCVTQINGTHEFVVEAFSGSTRIAYAVSPIHNQSTIHSTMVNTEASNVNDFGLSEFTDFYLAGNGQWGSTAQFFWYGPDGAFIAVNMSIGLEFCIGQTFCATGPEFIPTSEFVFFQPQGQSTVNFPSDFNIPIFIGQENAGPTISMMQYTNATNNIDMTPVAAQILGTASSNVCEDNLVISNPSIGQTVFPDDLGLTFTMQPDTS